MIIFFNRNCVGKYHKILCRIQKWNKNWHIVLKIRKLILISGLIDTVTNFRILRISEYFRKIGYVIKPPV